LPVAHAEEQSIEEYTEKKQETQEKPKERRICQNFVVTAYYSPLPNQKKYNTGTLAAEKRLQGNGTNGASGKPVFDGMLAAPSTYKFGTKIEIGGKVYTVEDLSLIHIGSCRRRLRC